MVSGLTLDIQVQPSLEGVRGATDKIKQFLTESGIADHSACEFEIALVEALNNIVSHSVKSNHELEISISIECLSNHIRATITDNTFGFEWEEVPDLPEEFEESGRGLFLLHQLVDGVENFKGANTNILRLTKSLSDESCIKKLNDSDEVQETLYKMSEEFTLNSEMLSAIFNITKEISLGQSKGIEFIGQLLERLAGIIQSDWFMFFEYNRSKKSFELITHSNDIKNPQAIESSFSLLLKQILIQFHDETWENIANGNITLDINKTFLPFPYHLGYVKPVIIQNQLLGVLIIENDNHDLSSNASAYNNLIHTFSEFISFQIHARRQRDENIKSTKLKQELDIARNIQKALLPREIPVNGVIELGASCDTAQKVGGDFYGIEKISEDEYMVIIVDVMGKGVPAALIATICRTIITLNKPLCDSPGQILKAANKYLYNDLSSVEMFITAQIAYIDTKKKRMTFANAGHPPIIMRNGSHSGVQEICPEGLPIGIFEDTEFEEESLEIPDSFDLLMYTDGVTDTFKESERDFYGITRLKGWFAKEANKTKLPQEIIEQLKRELRSFTSNIHLTDDQTMIAISERRSDL